MRTIKLIYILSLIVLIIPIYSPLHAESLMSIVDKLDDLEARIISLENNPANNGSTGDLNAINNRIGNLETKLDQSAKADGYSSLENSIERLGYRLGVLESVYAYTDPKGSNDSTGYSTQTLAELKYLITELRETISETQSGKLTKQENNNSPDRKPVISGLFRTLWEYDDNTTSGNENDFSVSYGRLSIKGDMTDNIGYKLQVDFVRDSDDMLLDAYAFFNPTLWSKITVGQFKSPYSTVNLRSASRQRFIAKPLIASKTSPKTRDIGFAFCMDGENYSTVFGVFNGVGQNQPDDNSYKNLAGRIEYEMSPSLSFSGNAYYGKTNAVDSLSEELTMYNGGAIYRAGNLSIEGEYGYYETEGLVRSGYFVDALYEFQTGGVIKSITPGIRYDWYDPDYDIGADVQTRYSAGLMFEFTRFPNMHARINYLIDDTENSSSQDKQILSEIQLTF